MKSCLVVGGCRVRKRDLMARFGVEKARLIASGTPVEDADVLIAATALVCGGRIATGNVRHFSRFANLEVMAW